jgi:hypothetical protein
MAPLNTASSRSVARLLGPFSLLLAAIGCSSSPGSNAGPGSTSGTGQRPGIGGAGTGVGGSATATTAPANPGHVVVRRLSASEYDHTVRDLLGTTLTPGTGFPADDLGEEFDDVGSALSLSPTYVRAYEQAAYALVDDLISSTDQARKQRVLSCDVNTGGEACARTIVTAFARKAWRRPVSAEEATGLLVPVKKGAELSAKPLDGLRFALAGVLMSPFFIFKLELDPDPTSKTPRRLNSHELATRLSYALWSSMPDEQLFAAADSDALASDEGLETQIRRMLADPKAETLSDAFAGQWLNFRKLEDHELEPASFPAYSPALVTSMQNEARRYFREFLQNDLPVQGLLNARFSFMDSSLATFYGATRPAVGAPTDFVRVDTTNVERSGMLTMGAFLVASSLPTRTSVVRRGQYVYERFMCGEVPAPPPGIAGFPEPKAGLTARELSAQHRADPSCSGCHNIMDPLGFGLETYDALGAYRTMEGGVSIDTSGSLPGGASFRGGVELAEALAKDPRFVECVTKKLATFSLGRLMNQADDPQWVSYLSWKAGQSQPASLPVLLRTIIMSDAFRSRVAL